MQLRLRFAGKCVVCGREIAKGTNALYNRTTKTVRCIECVQREATAPTPPIDGGKAGGSAHREYLLRAAAREARVKGRLGNFLGAVALGLAGDSQTTAAWERGSVGEQKLAEALAGVDGIQVLNDRRVPGTKGNIDHIVIAPAGVFVVDAKRYEGLIEIRYRGGLIDRDDRLYVGSRDCSKLADNMAWQVEAVRRALEAAGQEFSRVPVQPVLCFIDGQWPIFAAPESFRGVRLEGARSIKKLVSGARVIDADLAGRLSQALAAAFPAK